MFTESQNESVLSPKKKIAIIGPAWPLRGGLATFDERLCKAFLDKGHECEIISFSLQYPKLLFPGKTQISESCAPEGIKIRAIINSINPLNWLWVGWQLKKHKFDLVVFRYWMSFMGPSFGTLARLIQANQHTQCIAITDNIKPHEPKFFDKWFTPYFLSSIRGTISMSEEVQKQAIALTKGKPAGYAPHPMYDMFGPAVNKQKAIEALGLNPNYTYLLFFGFIRKYKGLSLLLDSFALSNWRELGLRLLIAGEFYENSTPYIQQVTELGIQEAVIFHSDFIPDNKVSLYFSASDLVVQTYLSATQSVVTQIAYFYDKPMLVTNVGGLAELVPHNEAGLVCSIDKVEIAAAINKYFSEDLSEEFTKGVKANKVRFTWDYLVNQLLSLKNTESSL